MLGVPAQASAGWRLSALLAVAPAVDLAGGTGRQVAGCTALIARISGMNRDEARKWLYDHGVRILTAERMLDRAVTIGSSQTINGVFVTHDGQMFNVYDS